MADLPARRSCGTSWAPASSRAQWLCYPTNRAQNSLTSHAHIQTTPTLPFWIILSPPFTMLVSRMTCLGLSISLRQGRGEGGGGGERRNCALTCNQSRGIPLYHNSPSVHAVHQGYTLLLTSGSGCGLCARDVSLRALCLKAGPAIGELVQLALALQ